MDRKNVYNKEKTKYFLCAVYDYNALAFSICFSITLDQKSISGV